MILMYPAIRRLFTRNPLMTDNEKNLDTANLVTVAERTDELSASIVVSVLEEDAERARQVIDEIKMDPPVFDE